MPSAGAVASRDRQRPEHEAEGEHRQAEAHRAIREERSRALALEGARGEQARDQEKRPHKEGLVHGGEQGEDEVGLVGRAVEPAPARAVGDRRVVGDDEDRQAHPQAVDPGLPASDRDRGRGTIAEAWIGTAGGGMAGILGSSGERWRCLARRDSAR